MRNHTILLSFLASMTASGCQALECAEGTIERDGLCQPADDTTGAGKCGPFTVLQGDRCVPMFPPTECDPGTTEIDVDPETGVATCIGTGGSGCGSPIACPVPTGASKQTICGQIYDFQNNLPYAAPMAAGQRCDPAMPAASGPCALGIVAYNALEFGADPAAAVPLTHGGVTIDECGRFKVADIEVSAAGPFVGLGFDDASGLGPGGTVVTAAIATGAAPKTATKGVEAYVVRPATVAMWTGASSDLATTGIYAPIFRAHKPGNPGDPFAPQAGVEITRGATSPAPIPLANADYFTAAATERTTIDGVATVTGANGTVFVNNARTSELLTFGGAGGLGPGCRWDLHAGASLRGIVFVQVFTKSGDTCND